jgi:hypothetical protein
MEVIYSPETSVSLWTIRWYNSEDPTLRGHHRPNPKPNTVTAQFKTLFRNLAEWSGKIKETPSLDCGDLDPGSRKYEAGC